MSIRYLPEVEIYLFDELNNEINYEFQKKRSFFFDFFCQLKIMA